jgi:demethylmenaquinone methyltransferase/2-methoxy-6-polyprenyl-1,4-benzoquinol methylase
MKVLESAPQRYDRGMRILTLGRLERIQVDIVSKLTPGDKVLDIGCGTGTLVLLLAQKDCLVTGIDVSAPMLRLASQRIGESRASGNVMLMELGAANLDTAFADGSFDAVTSTLVFSELSRDEMAYVLAECRRILRSGGELLIADEVLPDTLPGRALTFLLRLPFAVLAHVLTQTTTRRVAGLEGAIEEAGFRILGTRSYLAKTLKLVVAERGN